MGGDRVSPLLSSADEDSLLDQEFQEYPLGLPALYREDDLSSKIDDGSLIVKKGLILETFDDEGSQSCKDSLCFQANQRRAQSVYCEILRSYDELQSRTNSLEEAKLKILSYKPGKWTEKVGGMKLSDYNIPKTTTLLLIGPERSGKSSLVNRISRVFDNDKFAPERAQVSYNPDGGDGTYFLQEYMIPRASNSFCLYDTRSLSDNEYENYKMLKHWMTKGVRNGELVCRSSDGPNLETRMKCKSHQNLHCSTKTRMVNFVIFVVNGLSVLNSMDSDDEADEYNKMIATMFNCPFLSFRDDKPALVITHGDLLSLSDRARVRVHLGKLLGIPPKKQVFDIPVAENCDPSTEMTIVDLLRHSLEHADKNLPAKGWFLGKIHKVQQPGSILLVLILGIAIISALVRDNYFYKGHGHHVRQTDSPIGTEQCSSNDAPRADDTVNMNTVHASQTDVPLDKSAARPAHTSSEMRTQHAPEKYALISTSVNNALLEDDPSDMNTMHAPQTSAPIDKNNDTEAYQTDKNAINAQRVTPMKMKGHGPPIYKNDDARAHHTDAPIDKSAQSSAQATPQTKATGLNPKRVLRKGYHIGKNAGIQADENRGKNARTSPRLTRKTRTSHQPANDATNEGTPMDLYKMRYRTWLGDEYV